MSDEEQVIYKCFICEEVHGPLEECHIFGLAYDQLRQIDLLEGDKGESD